DAVACIDRDPGRAQAASAALPGAGHFAVAADVGDDASMATMHDAVLARWGAPDVLVNNAGIASGGSLLDSTMAEWREVLEVNLLGVVRGCQAFLPGMLERGSGSILNIASFAALAGAPSIMSYGVAKGGVLTLSEQLRAELHGQGVSVSVACPAFFQTNLLQQWRGNEAMKAHAAKMMSRSSDTLDGVADNIFDAFERGRFLILPTRGATMHWRLRRWLPSVYFRQLMAQVGPRASSTKTGAAR
ncbi:MAG: SDR family NAD(P)-dependent oxidoreductase, partial [Lysobacter sp.]|nr:SDR family NAD(P)-dependent oxidoreductase [Lysobacter sp.]MDQ3270317.1 SDR family NAD(P)-dependent oxidoreductase [Pseudomonadota bacterium]